MSVWVGLAIYIVGMFLAALLYGWLEQENFRKFTVELEVARKRRSEYIKEAEKRLSDLEIGVIPFALFWPLIVVIGLVIIVACSVTFVVTWPFIAVFRIGAGDQRRSRPPTNEHDISTSEARGETP